MTFRRERLVVGEDFGVFRVSGRLDAENVDTLRELVGPKSGSVAIDLNEVTLVDRDAIKFLAVSETNVIELRNSPAYRLEHSSAIVWSQDAIPLNESW